MIFPRTEPEIAQARLKVWQRRKRLQFLEQVVAQLRAFDRRGLAKKDMAEVLRTAAESLDPK
jgi:hypothetical protein